MPQWGKGTKNRELKENPRPSSSVVYLIFSLPFPAISCKYPSFEKPARASQPLSSWYPSGNPG